MQHLVSDELSEASEHILCVNIDTTRKSMANELLGVSFLEDAAFNIGFVLFPRKQVMKIDRNSTVRFLRSTFDTIHY